MVGNNVLVVPLITKNLVSIRRFAHDNKYDVNFNSFSLFVKELGTQKTLHCYNSYGPIYPLVTYPAKAFIPQAFLSSKVSS